MKKLLHIFLILVLLFSTTIPSQASRTIETSEPEYSYNDMTGIKQQKIPNMVLVYPKKMNENSVRIYFQNIGIDTVDRVTATLLLIDQFGHPVYREYTVWDLNIFINQSFVYATPNWKTAQIVNVRCWDGNDKDVPLKNSDIIYNN